MEFSFYPTGYLGKSNPIDWSQIRVRVKRFLLAKLFLILGLDFNKAPYINIFV